jgi:hypothetical protein
VKRLRDKLTYANVVATLALFVALGGSSYAALTITGRDVKDGSLTARDIKRNALGGGRIKESELGTVRRAQNANRLGGLTAQRLLLKCPAGTLPAADVCVETAARPTTGYTSAEITCSQVNTPRTPGRRLPSYAELRAALSYEEVALSPGGELSNHIYLRPGTDQLDVLVVTSETGRVALTQDNNASPQAFRCVTDPLN